MIEVKYYNKLDIFHEHFVGGFTIDDLISHYISVGENNYLPRKLNVIVDYTQAEFNFDLDNLDELAETIRQNVIKYKYVKAAILHAKPYEQVISMMFESLVKEIPNFYTEIFTTKKAAIRWLLLHNVERVIKKELIKKEG